MTHFNILLGWIFTNRLIVPCCITPRLCFMQHLHVRIKMHLKTTPIGFYGNCGVLVKSNTTVIIQILHMIQSNARNSIPGIYHEST